MLAASDRHHHQSEWKQGGTHVRASFVFPMIFIILYDTISYQITLYMMVHEHTNTRESFFVPAQNGEEARIYMGAVISTAGATRCNLPV